MYILQALSNQVNFKVYYDNDLVGAIIAVCSRLPKNLRQYYADLLLLDWSLKHWTLSN